MTAATTTTATTIMNINTGTNISTSIASGSGGSGSGSGSSSTGHKRNSTHPYCIASSPIFDASPNAFTRQWQSRLNKTSHMGKWLLLR